MKAVLLSLWNRLHRRVGPYQLAALSLLLLSLLLATWALELDRQSNAMRGSLQVKRAARLTRPEPMRRQMPIVEQVDEFVAGFPPILSNASDLEQVFLSASHYKLQLTKGEYKYKQVANEPLVSYTATFPLHADYGSIRDFSADVLQALPNASMEELHMVRSSADSIMLEAVIRFTFVYRR
jgi:hypothetical protein